MTRTRPGPDPRPPRPPGKGGRIDPTGVDALVDRVVLDLTRRAFVYDDPDSYREGVSDSATVLRDALRQLTD